MINLRFVLLILAFLLFAVAAFNVPCRINLVAAGLALMVLAQLTA